MKTSQSGQLAEQLACEYLVSLGYTTITRNYRCRLGEVDLVMRSPENILVFVEVRFRQGAFHGSATESVDYRKQQKLLLTARHFIASSRSPNQPARIDVIGVCPIHGNAADQNSQHLYANRSVLNGKDIQPDNVRTMKGYAITWTPNAVQDE